MDIGPAGRRDFEKVEAESTATTKDSLKMFYDLYWSGLSILKDTIELVIKDHTDHPDSTDSKFRLILLMLSNRSIQHVESIRILTESGLYGDAAGLMRSILDDVSMILYLGFHPEFEESFLQETENTYKENGEFKNRFSEGTIERDLISRGVHPASRILRLLSKSLHASAFGSQWYGTEGKGGQYNFKYGPKFEAKKALVWLASIASVHYDLVVQILAHYEEKFGGSFPLEWNAISDRAIALKEQVDIFQGAAQATLQTLWPSISQEDSQTAT